MAEEYREGSTDPVVPGTGNDQAPDQKQDDKSTLPVYDGDVEELKGKTMDEIVKMFADRNKTVGRQGQEIGKLRADLAHIERTQRLGPQPKPDEPAPDTEASEDPLGDMEDDQFVKVADVKKMLRTTLQKYDGEKQTSDVKKLRDMARVAHSEMAPRFVNHSIIKGKSEDGSDNIMDDVGKVIHDSLRPAVERGYDVSHIIRADDTWVRAAKYVRFMRGEYDYLSDADRAEQERNAAESSGNPVPPYNGEVPMGRTGNRGGKVELDAKGRFIKNKFNLTDEEIEQGLASIKKQRGY